MRRTILLAVGLAVSLALPGIQSAGAQELAACQPEIQRAGQRLQAAEKRLEKMERIMKVRQMMSGEESDTFDAMMEQARSLLSRAREVNGGDGAAQQALCVARARAAYSYVDTADALHSRIMKRGKQG